MTKIFCLRKLHIVCLLCPFVHCGAGSLSSLEGVVEVRERKVDFLSDSDRIPWKSYFSGEYKGAHERIDSDKIKQLIILRVKSLSEGGLSTQDMRRYKTRWSDYTLARKNLIFQIRQQESVTPVIDTISSTEALPSLDISSMKNATRHMEHSVAKRSCTGDDLMQDAHKRRAKLKADPPDQLRPLDMSDCLCVTDNSSEDEGDKGSIAAMETSGIGSAPVSLLESRGRGSPSCRLCLWFCYF